MNQSDEGGSELLSRQLTKRRGVGDSSFANHYANPLVPAGFAVGARVRVTGYPCGGTVQFAGAHHVSGHPRLGIVLDAAVGNNDGVVKGHRYFQCEPKRGVLVAPAKVAADTASTSAGARAATIVVHNPSYDGLISQAPVAQLPRPAPFNGVCDGCKATAVTKTDVRATRMRTWGSGCVGGGAGGVSRRRRWGGVAAPSGPVCSRVHLYWFKV